MRATLVIPTLNEELGIGPTLRDFNEAVVTSNRTLFASDPVTWEVLVVDGNSTDRTREIAEKAGAKVIVETRKGYGRAYKTGFAAATGDFVATMDGDGTYPAEIVPWFLLHVIFHQKDFVIGDRLTYLEPKAMTTEHRIGNWMLNYTLEVLFHECVKGTPARVLVDSQSGMWVFRRSILDKVRPEQDGMAFSEEFKLEALLAGLRVEEVPIHYSERWGRPKLSSWTDGLRNMEFIWRKRFRVSMARKVARRLSAARAADSP